MAKRVFIIHGWGATPQKEQWMTWLKDQLLERDFTVSRPQMPDTNNPKIDAWVGHLAEVVGTPDAETVFVGHSIGCQTILRYLAGLDGDSKVTGIIMVAPWVNLTEASYESPQDRRIAAPWINTPINWRGVLRHLQPGRVTSILSDNDPYVPLSEARIFEKELGAKTIVEHNKGHIFDESGVKELPSALREVLSMSGQRTRSKR